ncbi:MFS transporter [Nocardia terpenica]|nr:MFS transporter [Nocardia terpenica]MBF6107646.1 MFS transporter [Nocardia terpenica]MBF6109979.1 MFS transporter [Nocardia terpenica]MBF6122509.1 MFS transporter [Nocardia terpenica]MBF6151315.1 MFS transporter [Nocardia terpenica]
MHKEGSAVISETGRSAQPGATLAAVCAAISLVPVVATGAGVALPGISADLHTSLASAQWVVNAFFLTFASFMAVTGSLADMIGRRRMFSAGIAVFCTAMVIAGLAPHITVLVGARVIAGMGAAAVLTGGSAVLANTFQGAARARAFAVYGTGIGLGLAFGPLIAGVIVTSLGGWRVFFLAAAVILLPVLAFSLRLPDSRDVHPAGIDWRGGILFTAGLFMLVLCAIEGPAVGWTKPLIIASCVAAVALLVAFVLVERRTDHPLIEISLFTERRFVAICLMPVLLAFGFVAPLMVLPQYFMAVDGASAQSAGLLMVLMTGPTLVLPMLVGTLSRHVSQRTLLIVVLALTALGAGWLTVLRPHLGIVALAGPLIAIGAGFGVSLAFLDGAAVASVESSRAGMAAGVFNTMRLGGESISIAVLGAIITGVTTARLHATLPAGQADALTTKLLQGDPSGVTAATADGAFSAYTSAMHIGLWSVCLLAVLGIVGILALTRETPETIENNVVPEEMTVEGVSR